MRELARREKVIIVVVAVAVVVFLMQRFLIEPQSRKLRELRAELTDLSKQTTGIGPKLVEFNQLNSNLIQKKRDLAKLEQALSKKAELAEIINAVSRQARTHGLRLQQLRPQRATPVRTQAGGRSGEFRQLNVDIGIRGRYQDLGDFLTALEEQPFFVRVAELRVQRRGAGGPLLEINLKLAIVMRS
jgi:Tfp pilus assembly protein PilO